MITEKQRIARKANANKLNKSGLAIHIGSKNGRWKGGVRIKNNYPCPSCGKDRVCEGNESWRLCIECGHAKRANERIGMKMSGNYAKGEKHYRWNGGITLANKALRSSHEYRNWRRKIFERDNYTCVLCVKRGGSLQADHIKPFSIFPELRYNLNNGRTLCFDCHKKTDTFRKSRKQLEALYIATDPTMLTYSYT